MHNVYYYYYYYFGQYKDILNENILKNCKKNI